MSVRPDSSIVRDWGKHRQPQQRPRLPTWALVTVLVASGVGAIGLTVWLAVRPHPWRPPSGTPVFASCAYDQGRIPAWCARIAVPEDPAEPHGRSISLWVVVLPATRRPAAGALFYLEGGPGGAATQSGILVNTVFAQVERTRDVVMVDQRGTGESNAITCPGDVRADVTSYVRRCFARNDARLYTSSVAAADLDSVRRTLGYGKIDLYGGSYGATLAQVYLHLYPQSVRSAVLSSTSLTDVRLYDVSARNAQHALDVLLRRCGGPCSRTRAQLDEILRRAPRRVATPGKPVVLTADDVAWAVDALSETPSGAATIPFVVAAAAHGDYLPLALADASDIGSIGRLAAFWEIVCSEPWSGFDPVATARNGAGSYLLRAAVDRAKAYRSACRAVPGGRVAPGAFSTAPVRAPVLLLAGGADPLDPVANLAGWRRVFPDGRLVVVPGAGHGLMEYGCVQTLVARFVTGGTAAGLDTACARRVPLPPFTTG